MADIKEANALLKEMVVDYLEKCVREKIVDRERSYQTYELEVSFGNRKPITRTDYESVIHHLMRFGWKTTNMQGEEMLRINCEFVKIGKVEEEPEVVGGAVGRFTTMHMSTNFRLEIKGANLIQEYCRNDSIDSIKLIDPQYDKKMKFTEKKPVVKDGKGPFQMARFQDHNFRVAYKTEYDSNVDNTRSLKVKETLRNWGSTKKTFRCMNRVRFAHPDFPVFVDVSVIKTNSKTRFNNREVIIPANTLSSSNAFRNAPHYEIELEIDNTRMQNTTIFREMTPENMIEMIKKCVRMVLSGLQDTPYPISYSEQDKIYAEYTALLHGVVPGKHRNPETSDFIGPQSIALQQFNIYTHGKNVNSHVQKSVVNNYMVTEKADGQRALLFISSTGKIYMINGRMKIIFTGASTLNQNCFNSLLDGEFIMTGKDKTNLFLYAAFDIYYVGSRKDPHVRPLPFAPVDGGLEVTVDESKYRLLLLRSFVDQLQPKSVAKNSNSSCLFRIQAKQFYSGNTVFEACKNVLALKDVHAYETDGLILTPMNAGVGSDKPNSTGPLKKHTWNLSFKWKPPEYNTIDFYIMTEKDQNKDKVKYLIHDNTEIMSKTVAYKTLYLHVGVNPKFAAGEESVFQRVLEDKMGVDEIHVPEENSNYVPRLFKPTTPYDPTAYICHIPLDEHMRMKTVPVEKDGTPEVFDDLTIVEFRWAQPHENKNGHWKWIPIRVRHDKTAILRSTTAKDYGNSFQTANSNWLSIHCPVTENMITGLESVSPMEAEDDVYYDKLEKESNFTVALKHFHNKYIKYKLIMGPAQFLHSLYKEIFLIDFSVGRAGDLTKWKYSNINFVLGIDLSKDNIMTRADSACARYLDMRKKNKAAKLRALFFQGDSSKNIRTTQDAFSNTLDKQLIRSIFGKGDVPDAKTKYVFRHGFAKEGFHISSSQFALHYFFESVHTLHRFLRNVSECTRINGYFIGTCYDGKEVFRVLQNSKFGSFRVDKNKTTLCEITKKYDVAIKKFPIDEASVGMRVDVYQESIGNTISEYLVSFDYLTRLLENYGFSLVPKSELELMGFTESHGSFETLFNGLLTDKTSDWGSAIQMTKEEKNISFLNRYFIYKKMRDVNGATLANMVSTLGAETIAKNERVEEKVIEKVNKSKKERIILVEDSSNEDEDEDEDDVDVDVEVENKRDEEQKK